MRLTGPTRQSGKAGLRLRRSDRGHRAFIGGAFAALMALGGCDPGDFRKPERAAEKPAVRPYCETNDCSDFPKGYYSIELNGEWIYIPGPEFLRAAMTDDVLRPLVDGSSGKVEHVLPRLEVSAKGGYRYPDNFDRDVTDVIERDGQVVPDASFVRLGGCCEGLGAFYGLTALQEVRVSDLRSPSGGIMSEAPLLPSSYNVLHVEDAPEEWKGVSARFDLQLLESKVDDPVPGRFHAWSKAPLIQGSRVLLRCSDISCWVEWDSKQEGPFSSGLIPNASLGLCPRGATGCYTRELIDGSCPAAWCS